MKDKLFEKGLKLRKRVLGAEYVQRQLANADELTMPMQELATKAAWGMVWARPGLPRRVRSMLNIAMLVALGKAEELELHLDGAIRNGVTKKEIGEVLLHTAIYCGFPAALGGFRVAREYFATEKKRK
jgi:4-carboxymuconolactone decarboxylase